MDKIRMFRKLSLSERLALLESRGLLDADMRSIAACAEGALFFSDILIESAAGTMPLPLGIATGFLIDGKTVHIPMATEEASVVLAAGYAGSIIAGYGGFSTSFRPPALTGQIIFSHIDSKTARIIEGAAEDMIACIRQETQSMEKREGGYRGHRYRYLADYLSVDIFIDTCDAMGANAMNHVLERARALLERASGKQALSAILSNYHDEPISHAEFSLPSSALQRAGMSGEVIAERIVALAKFAELDRYRAVTHNKGIMNGITALTLATGNDSRAVEAGIHAYAARDGQYRGLGTYVLRDGMLHASLSLPLKLATVGGACDVHPVARFSRRLLATSDTMDDIAENSEIDSKELSRTALALGIAQNFAALFALVSEGIQAGHMKQHKRRQAWKQGRDTMAGQAHATG